MAYRQAGNISVSENGGVGGGVFFGSAHACFPVLFFLSLTF